MTVFSYNGLTFKPKKQFYNILSTFQLRSVSSKKNKSWKITDAKTTTAAAAKKENNKGTLFLVRSQLKRSKAK